MDNDLIALGIMRALQEKGIRVPKGEIGQLAVRRLHNMIQNKETNLNMQMQVCTEFIERDRVLKL